MLIVHATKKLRDRLKSAPRHTDETSTTTLGSWYATALFWRPQVALFVNESTLLPVLVPLAPAATVVDRFVAVLGTVFDAHGASASFAEAEMTRMGDWRLSQNSQPQRGRRYERVLGLGRPALPRPGPAHLVGPVVTPEQNSLQPALQGHRRPDRALIALLSERGGFRPGSDGTGTPDTSRNSPGSLP